MPLVSGGTMNTSVAQEIVQLEEENELLRQQLTALTGCSQELGVLMALKHGMTHRMATILYILVKRYPAVITRDAFHTIVYGDRTDGGPEPKIFDVHICRLRQLFRRLKFPGKIETIWNAGYRASPELVEHIQKLYKASIPKED